ncbi:glycoside hydrolase family protein [Akkermansiaceae bacterium]|nr:glycoside hydrolase family protein [Akkermansiaceae bacterium]
MMKRRLLAIALLVTAPVALADEDPGSKKGICLSKNWGDTRKVEAMIGSLDVGWHYNWTGKWQGKDIKGVPFVPMIWGKTPWALAAIKEVRVAKSRGDSSPLLGFNEPDGKSQANMSVEESLDLWPQLEKTNRRLGSPVTVHADNEWMQAFMKGADERGYRVDFVCVHWYGGTDADKLVNLLERIHKLYGKPIWLTEFAPADWKAKTRKDNEIKPAEVLDFMEEALPKLDKLEFLERYAWFSSLPDHPKLGPSALFNADGSLTPLGEAYAAH